MHKLVGWVPFVVFEKFTSPYLFQIAREKSCDYLIINSIQEKRNYNNIINFDSEHIIFQFIPLIS